MSQLRELVEGESVLDTAFRALALAIFASVALALVWTTLSVRAPDYPKSDVVQKASIAVITGELGEQQQLSVFHKEQEQ